MSLDGHVASADGNDDWVAAGRSEDSTGCGTLRRESP